MIINNFGSTKSNTSDDVVSRKDVVASSDTSVLSQQLFRKRVVIVGSSLEKSERTDENSSTQEPVNIQQLEQQVYYVFSSARDQYFEDGYESEFSSQLKVLIYRYEKVAIDIICQLFTNTSINSEVLSEALRVIGKVDHKQTYRDRLWLLEHGLYHHSAYVRDGAVIGLSYVKDPQTVKPLQSAIEKEVIPELRVDMQKLIEHLME